MIPALRAPVRPRCVSSASGETILLDEAVESAAESIGRGAIEILGGRGAGKTTALQHLAATLAGRGQLRLLDEPEPSEVRVQSQAALVVFTSQRHLGDAADISFRLAPWTRDDVIEYLLHAHPDRCAPVMQELGADEFMADVAGAPQVWRLALDVMAGEGPVPDIRSALRRGLNRVFSDRHVQQLAGLFTLASLVSQDNTAEELHRELVEQGCGADSLGLLRHRAVRLLLASDQIVRHLHGKADRQLPSGPAPHDLIRETGRRIANDNGAIRRLKRLANGPIQTLQPISASLLHQVGARWRPRPGAFLEGSLLKGGRWEGVDLSGAVLAGAHLEEADLSGASLVKADLRLAHLARARLTTAVLDEAQLHGADLRSADVSLASAARASFRDAKLGEANLEKAILVGADLTLSELTGARLCGADLTGADLLEVEIEDADLSGAVLRAARLNGLALRKALVAGADFREAQLAGCDLEFVQLPDAKFARANLTRASLTGSVMRAADFCGAQLCHAGLADIAWEDADLSRADLSGCSFHMGSTRSGLVGSPYPGHGSRTGFYTNAYHERYYKSPEEIRKANLRRADLRGAKVTDVDFYLVDLRGARYDPQQAAHFRRCDAILDNWSPAG